MTDAHASTTTRQPNRPPAGDQSHPVDVPAGEEPHVCGHCGAPFTQAQLLALHRGLDHPNDLDEGERDAYEAALDDENDEIRRFRIIALGGLVLLYFGFLFAYAIFAV